MTLFDCENRTLAVGTNGKSCGLVRILGWNVSLVIDESYSHAGIWLNAARNVRLGKTKQIEKGKKSRER
jgi:hypothetical protein